MTDDLAKFIVHQATGKHPTDTVYRPTDIDVVRCVAEAWQTMWHSKWQNKLAVNCCILANRAACRVLTTYGIDAYCWPSTTIVANAEAVRLAEQGVPMSEWPDSAWSIAAVSAGGPAGLNGASYGGHVWCRGDDFVLDLSARQFHRPGRIECNEPIVAATEGDDGFTIERIDGTVIRAWPLADFTYRNSVDYRTGWRAVYDDLRLATAALVRDFPR